MLARLADRDILPLRKKSIKPSSRFAIARIGKSVDVAINRRTTALGAAVTGPPNASRVGIGINGEKSSNFSR
jgi:hypothetical protein